MLSVVLAACTLFAAVPVLLNGLAYRELARVRREDPDCEECPGGPAAIRAFLAECAATAAYLLFELPRSFSPNRQPKDADDGDSRRVIVLVPDRGLLAASHHLLRRRLQASGEVVVECPVHRGRTLDTTADALESCLNDLPPSPAEVVLLGVGTGGLAARHYLRRRRAPRVRRLFTVGCPHFGTKSTLAWRLGWNVAGADDPLLRRITALDRVPDQFAVTSIAGDFDAWILPLRHRDYPGAFNIQLRNHGHFALLAARRTVDLLVENLNA